MNKWLGTAIALVLVCNGAVLGRVVYNRSASESTVLEMNERELRLPWRYGKRNRDNSGISLQLVWNVQIPSDSDRAYSSQRYGRGGFPLTPELAQKLEIDLEKEKSSSERQRNRRAPSLTVWLALEFDGEAYHNYVKTLQREYDEMLYVEGGDLTPEEFERRTEAKQQRLQEAKETESRLFVIDMSKKRSTLEQQYANASGIVLVPGLVRMWRDNFQVNTVNIRKVMVDQIYVPLQHRSVVDKMSQQYYERDQPRFHASIAFGRLGEPWMESLSLLQPQEERINE